MSKATRLQSIYDALVDQVDAIMSTIGLSTVKTKRGFPRILPGSLQVPSTYLFMYGLDPSNSSQAVGQHTDDIKFSLTVFLRDELELIKLIGTLLDSPINGGFIDNNQTNVAYNDGQRVSSQQLPEIADFGFSFTITVLL